MTHEMMKPWTGDWCYGHGVTGMQKPKADCVVCRPPDPVQWAYQIGSKKMLAHAYPVGAAATEMPLCGRGIILRSTKSLESAKGRQNPVYKCPACEGLAGKPGTKGVAPRNG